MLFHFNYQLLFALFKMFTLCPLSFLCQMVRERRTARKQTGGSSRAYRALFVPAQPAPPAQPPPPAPVVEEEDPEEVHFFEEQEDPADPTASPLVVPVP